MAIFSPVEPNQDLTISALLRRSVSALKAHCFSLELAARARNSRSLGL
jgi:hypothetical protein